MLRSSPLTPRELLWAKFWGGFVPLVVVAETLVVVSNRMLHSTALLNVLSIASVLCLSAAIVGLAVGLGAVYPRFDAADGTEVAAGYAGILFMMFYSALVLKAPFTMFIETFLAPLLIFVLFEGLSDNEGRRLAWLIHFLMMCNALLGIYEFVTAYHLTPLGRCPRCGTNIAGHFGEFGRPFGNRRVPIAMHREHPPIAPTSSSV